MNGEFEDVVERVMETLADEEFDIPADIDVQAKIKEKLGLDKFRRYRILGTCNPPLARQGLDAELDLGLLLTPLFSLRNEQ